MYSVANVYRATGYRWTSGLTVLAGDPVPDEAVIVGPRVGISKAVDWPLRFRVREGRDRLP